jgi:hypothetical protein
MKKASTPTPFKKGEKVLRLNKHARKLQNKWHGPFTVSEVLAKGLSYKITTNGSSPAIVNIADLKKFKEPYLNISDSPPNDTSDNEMAEPDQIKQNSDEGKQAQVESKVRIDESNEETFASWMVSTQLIKRERHG